MRESLALSDKDIYIFGAGRYGHKCLDHFKRLGIDITAFMDNDYALRKRGEVEGLPVIEPSHIPGNVLVVISSMRYEYEIFKQLMMLGYDRHQILSFDKIITDYPINTEDMEEDINEYPSVIQLPMTFKCNMKCVMCGCEKGVSRNDLSPECYRSILQDPLFSQVTAIGINGGEPFIRKDLFECVECIVDSLKNLKNIYIISNGFFTERISNNLPEIKELCNSKGIRLAISISVDGIGEMHDVHRGLYGAFKHVEKTCQFLLEHQSTIADSINIICTITRYNIARINEMRVWSKKVGMNVNYNIATENARLENHDKVEDFSVFSDELARAMTEEFFYSLYLETGREDYFAIYLFVKTGRRFSNCPCRSNEWITLLPNGDISFCAPRSRVLGNCLSDSAFRIVKENIGHLNQIKDECCNSCGQYISGLDLAGKEQMYNDIILNNSVRW